MSSELEYVSDEPDPPPKVTKTTKGSQSKKQHTQINVDSDIEEIDPPPPSQSRDHKAPASRSRKPASQSRSQSQAVQVNGKGKGKAKAPPEKPSRAVRAESESRDAMDMDESADELMATRPTTSKAPSNSSKTSRTESSSKFKRLEQQVAKLKTQLKSRDEQCKTMQHQFQDLSDLRETHAEDQRRQMEESFEAQLKSKETLVTDLLSKVGERDPLYSDGTFSVATLMTRGDADAERRAAEDEIARLRTTLDEQNKTIQDHDAKVAEMVQTIKELKYEAKLQSEKANLAQQLTKNPDRRPAASLASEEEPKHAIVISYYESLTDLLITHAQRHPPKYLDKDEWILTCVYSPQAETNPDGYSLSFNMRFCWDLDPESSEPVTSEDQLINTVHYAPIGLAGETPAFVEALNFLNGPFTFTKDQLHLFLSTLKDRLNDAASTRDGGGSVIEID